MVVLDNAGRETNVFGNYPNVDRVMELKIITVNEEYRRLGICKALINKSKYIKHNLFINVLLLITISTHFNP